LIGKGSNIIIDPHFSIPYAQISPTFSKATTHQLKVCLPAFMPVHKVMQYCTEQGLSGLEFMAGVPACVGGMVSMNFGCWGYEVSQFLTEALIVDENAEIRQIKNTDLAFTYRNSQVQKKNWNVLQATVQLEKKDPLLIKREIKNKIQTRLNKQPLKQKTFGSIFKNPSGHAAGRLIESSQLKGHKIGDAMISDQHANFMINSGKASFEDAYHLIQHVINTVYHTHGIMLEPEVKILTKSQSIFF